MKESMDLRRCGSRGVAGAGFCAKDAVAETTATAASTKVRAARLEAMTNERMVPPSENGSDCTERHSRVAVAEDRRKAPGFRRAKLWSHLKNRPDGAEVGSSG